MRGSKEVSVEEEKDTPKGGSSLKIKISFDAAVNLSGIRVLLHNK
jgi:hypothetical protein